MVSDPDQTRYEIVTQLQGADGTNGKAYPKSA
jgi:hypothetical protein